MCHLLLLKIIRTTGESFCVIFAFVAILSDLNMRLAGTKTYSLTEKPRKQAIRCSWRWKSYNFTQQDRQHEMLLELPPTVSLNFNFWIKTGVKMCWEISFEPPMQWETENCCDIICKISGRVADESENYFNMFFKHRKKMPVSYCTAMPFSLKDFTWIYLIFACLIRFFMNFRQKNLSNNISFKSIRQHEENSEERSRKHF